MSAHATDLLGLCKIFSFFGYPVALQKENFQRESYVPFINKVHLAKGQPNLPFQWGTGALSNTVLLGTTRVNLSSGISFRPTALAGCTSVTDDIQTTDRPRYGNTCRAQ